MAYDSSDLDGARFNEARFDYARFNVTTGKYQRLFSQLQRQLTRRVANWNTPRDDTTGWQEPTFTDETIRGVLIERGRVSRFAPVGVIVMEDAVLVTLDGLAVGDQVYDSGSRKYFTVTDEPKIHFDESRSFSFRTCQLRFLPYYWLGGPGQGIETFNRDVSIPVIIFGDYYLCVLDNEYFTLLLEGVGHLCSLGVVYMDAVSPTSSYVLSIITVRLEATLPDASYNLCVSANENIVTSPDSSFVLSVITERITVSPDSVYILTVT